MGTRQVIEIVTLVVGALAVTLSSTTIIIRYKFRNEIKQAERLRALRALSMEKRDREYSEKLLHDDMMAGAGRP
jgi:hypothetical protein